MDTEDERAKLRQEVEKWKVLVSELIEEVRSLKHHIRMETKSPTVPCPDCARLVRGSRWSGSPPRCMKHRTDSETTDAHQACWFVRRIDAERASSSQFTNPHIVEHLFTAPRAEARPSTDKGWQSISTAPKDDVALFWVVPKTPEEAYCNTSGDPIFGTFAPYLFMGKSRTWSSLSKATHWRPLPAPPRAEALALQSQDVDLRQVGMDLACERETFGLDEYAEIIGTALETAFRQGGAAALARSAPAEKLEVAKDEETKDARVDR